MKCTDKVRWMRSNGLAGNSFGWLSRHIALSLDMIIQQSVPVAATGLTM